MPNESLDPKVEIAHVLTMDVVAYSTLLITEQTRLMAELTRLVKATPRFQRAEAEGKLIRVPTGDGMLLIFFDEPQAAIECGMEVAAAVKAHPEIKLRMGIHSGPVHRVVDVNERANVAGAGVDMAQRVMDCGDAGHILLSQRVADDLAPFPRWHPHLHPLGECEVKHGRKISLVNFYTDEIGRAEPPNKCAALPETMARSTSSTRGRGWLYLLGAIVLIFALSLGAWLISLRQPAKTIAASRPGKSIAVLPFENLSRDADNAYFADGIQEEILSRLAKVADLKVISRTSTQRYKSNPGNLSEIARELNVENILEGTVQKAGNTVRVNVQLINAPNDSHLWADEFNRTLTDVFAVETEIASKIADTLQARLSGAEQSAISARPTENPEAHELYLRGRFCWNKFFGPDFPKSREYYERALQLDPNYALAYAGLADFFGYAFANGLLPPNEENARLEEDNAKKAMQLDPSLGEPYNALAAATLYFHRDWPAAEKLFQRGFQLSPNFAEMHQHYSLCLILFNRTEEAFAEMRRALELDPLSARFGCSMGRLYLLTRDYDAAITQLRKTLELDPNAPFTHEWLAFAYEKKKMPAEAIAEWSKALSLGGHVDQAGRLEETFAREGFEAAARAQAQESLREFQEKTARGEYVPALEFVLAYLRLDDREQAFQWLEKAAAERSRLALELKTNPRLDPLRDDPRFDKIVTLIPAQSK